MKFQLAIIVALVVGVIVPLVNAVKIIEDFETFNEKKGQVISKIKNNIDIVAYKNEGSGSSADYRLGMAMIFDTANPTGGDDDLGTPNEKYKVNNKAGPGKGKAGEAGINANTVALGKVLIISESCSSNDPDDNGSGGYFEITFPEPYVIHRVGLLDNEEGIDFETWDASNNYEKRSAGNSGDNGVQTFNFVDEALGPIKRLKITLKGSGAITFLEYEKASEVATFACALPTDADKFSLITSRNANNGAHSMYKGMAIGGLLTDESPNESGTVDNTMSFIQAMTAQSKYNFNKGVTYNQTVPLSMYEHFAYLARNAVSSNANGYTVVVLTTGGNYNLYNFVPGGQGEDNGKTLVIFNTRDAITISGTSDGRQFGPSIIAPFADVYVNSNAGFVDGMIMAKNFRTPPGCGSLQLHGEKYLGTIQCRSLSAPVKAPTKFPTKAPTKRPTKAPTKLPTKLPTKRPTKRPTKAPTKLPTKAPTKLPTKRPTKAPTKLPTKAPTKRPTKAPTKVPTKLPTKIPTKAPTKRPTLAPLAAPVKGPTVSGDDRNGDGITSNCMEDNWKASGKKMNLVCTAKEVSLVNLKATVRSSCIIGQNLTLSLNGTVQFNTARYDPAWFIAKDGGDALTGKCFIQPLLKGNLTTVDIFSAVGSTTKVGQIEWTKDFKGTNDACGDIIMNTGGGGVLQSVDIAKDLTLICDDKNRDGVLDIGICFSWREPGADDTCNVKSVYPGAPSKCFCTRYDIPQVTITTNDDPVDECY